MKKMKLKFSGEEYMRENVVRDREKKKQQA